MSGTPEVRVRLLSVIVRNRSTLALTSILWLCLGTLKIRTAAVLSEHGSMWWHRKFFGTQRCNCRGPNLSHRHWGQIACPSHCHDRECLTTSLIYHLKPSGNAVAMILGIVIGTELSELLLIWYHAYLGAMFNPFHSLSQLPVSRYSLLISYPGYDPVVSMIILPGTRRCSPNGPGFRVIASTCCGFGESEQILGVNQLVQIETHVVDCQVLHNHPTTRSKQLAQGMSLNQWYSISRSSNKRYSPHLSAQLILIVVHPVCERDHHQNYHIPVWLQRYSMHSCCIFWYSSTLSASHLKRRSS